MYHDEDTEEPIKCAFCDAPAHCKDHLFASIDLTNLSVNDGYLASRPRCLRDFEDPIRQVFTEMLLAGVGDATWEDGGLRWLWRFAVQEWDELGRVNPENLSIFDEYYPDFLDALFEDAGAVPFWGSVECGEPMVGMSSAYRLLWAEDPAATYAEALALLEKRLQQRVIGVGE